LLQTTSASALPRLIKPLFVLVNVFFYIYQVCGVVWPLMYAGLTSCVSQIVILALDAQYRSQLPTAIYNGDVYMVAALTLVASLLSSVLAVALLRRLSQTMQMVRAAGASPPPC
jgi:hypothetical protein